MIDDQQAQRALLAAEQFDCPRGAIVADPGQLFIEQHYEGYTAADQETWRRLMTRQLDCVEKHASESFLQGVHRLKLSARAIPRLSELSNRLAPMTGWQSRAVPGYLPARAFFACLAERSFPTTVVIRPPGSLGYLPEPDIFHDVFGHVPLHSDPDFADFLQLYGATALSTQDPAHTLRLARLFWFTVEFGLIAEPSEVKLYGSGLLSSPEEAVHALESPDVEHRPFDLDEVCETDFEIDHFQPVLFVLEDFAQLRDAMRRYSRRLRH